MRFIPAVALLAVLINCSQAGELPVAAPEAHGFDSGGLAALVTAAQEGELPIHSLIAMRGGDVVLDVVFYPYDGASLHDVASVTKSVMTTLIGIAAGEDSLALDAPLLSFFPDRQVANRDPRKERITIEHLTRNLSGLACIGYPEEVTLAQMQASPDYVQFTLDLPMTHEPGTRFDYCSPGMHLLSAVLQQATGKTALEYAREKLFAPLGITEIAWDVDPQGVSRGWGDLHLHPHDMVRLGMLWMAGGAWDGRQLVPAAWLERATTVAAPSHEHEDYGAGFWVGPKEEPIPYFFASGRGGQRILAAESLELIIVTTGGGFDPGDAVDPVVGTLRDPARPLPANSAGEAALRAAVAQAAAAPAASPVPPLPPLAAEISGRLFRFPSNPVGIEAISLDFDGGAEATFTLMEDGVETRRPIGLDGVYRFSPGANQLPLGVRGGWIDAQTFTLDHNSIGDLRAYTITAVFADEGLELTIAQRDEPLTLRLSGRAE